MNKTKAYMYKELSLTYSIVFLPKTVIFGSYATAHDATVTLLKSLRAEKFLVLIVQPDLVNHQLVFTLKL